MEQSKHPLASICSLWLSKIDLALKYKKKVFGNDAAEAMRFFNGPHDFQYEGEYVRAGRNRSDETADIPYFTFRMSANKVAELVALYGPLLYHRNPYRMVEPRKHWLPPESFFIPPQLAQMAQEAQAQGQQLPPQIAQMLQMGQQHFQQLNQAEQTWADQNQARTQLLQGYLNVTPRTLRHKEEMRLYIDEALITGMGVMCTELYQPPGSKIKMAGSWYLPEKNFVCDPDMEQIKLAKWIAVSETLPTWQIEQDYNLPPKTLQGSMESMDRSAEVDADKTGDLAWSRKHGRSNDLARIWKVYSRMGIGGRLDGADPGLRNSLDRMGENCYLVLCRDVPYPLNMAPNLLREFGDAEPEVLMQEISRRLDWPIPFWEDDEWPITELSFRDVPGQPYPMSIVKPALGYQKFLNWCYSFLAAKVKNTSRDFLAIPKSANEELKQAILNGGDLALLEIEAGNKEIKEMVQFLQHPPMNGDIIKVLEMIEAAFEKATGMSEAMYGVNRTQPRSAQESAMRGDMLRLRPDDMAEKVESAATRIAKKEAIAAAWALKSQDVAPVLGQTAAMFWDQLIADHDFQSIVHEFDYKLEAGSSRKPNKEKAIADTTEGVQVLMPILENYAGKTGDVGPINAFMEDWCKARDFESAGYMLKPPPPQQGPTPEQIKAQADAQAMQQKAQLDAQTAQQKMQLDQQKAAMDAQSQQQKLQADQQKAQSDIQAAQAKAQLEMVQGALDLELQRKRGAMELSQLQAKGTLEQKNMEEKNRLQKEAAKAKPNGAKK